MCRIISVTNRHIAGDFLKRISEIASLGVPMILREKDLSESAYAELAEKVLDITGNIILHTYVNTARDLGHMKIHLPMRLLEASDISGFDTVGASVHSVEEALRAQELGASYITAGHIFATDCKKDIPPRGLEFLRDVCSAVEIPVYAIGGITPQNASKAASAGAYGVCVMSSFMAVSDIGALYKEFKTSSGVLG